MYAILKFLASLILVRSSLSIPFTMEALPTSQFPGLVLFKVHERQLLPSPQSNHALSHILSRSLFCWVAGGVGGQPACQPAAGTRTCCCSSWNELLTYHQELSTSEILHCLVAFPTSVTWLFLQGNTQLVLLDASMAFIQP